ncbi:uncharacterized protein HMPREF1541_04448 [Cyphellophora europaea CBS 101466]|uniref:Heterokaryon incompatibility domain-containing protein n=1 Tax=Cyphellophora europaea (strain CBS 101466) TaxID=1220924 RepID=W2RUP5_CYPE1|nr:uncharacterized protein HMPREF1541_04448 [Cyphellophora europaea CBS 101466]ETN40172.1 hypothetical protein HMPREF1541_04448 [Cyphellophora europaea CBS 101466]
MHLSLTKNTFTGPCRLQVQDWLSDCTKVHDICNEDWGTTSDYPIRLLNVGPEMGTQVRLQLFEHGAIRPRYVTMSHCWNHGPAPQLVKLTTDNQHRLTSGFAIADLPKKFQDAVAIARWMDVNFIWIDALCIMQDSKDDWQHQANNVGDIYAGSYCNIAATNADQEVGCFRNRPVEIVEPYLVDDPKKASHKNSHVIGYDDFWCNSLLDSTLHTRAWVLQERLLSPRTIHFGKEQMFWECRQHKACEAYPLGIPTQFSNERTRDWRAGVQMFNPESRTPGVIKTSILAAVSAWFSGWLRPSKPTPHVIPCQEAYEFWSRTVERYMECGLTFQSDKLVAIAGLAKKVCETTGERYLAGLWDNVQLPQSLLWYVPVREQAGGSPSKRAPSLGSPDYRAPSWSWASIDAKITWDWPAPCGRVLITILETNIERERGSGTSAITSARMDIKGILISAKLQISHNDAGERSEEDGSYIMTFPGKASETNDSGSTRTARQIEPMVFLDISLSSTEADEFFFLPVCTDWRSRAGLSIAAVAGLLLKRARCGKENMYERIGVVGMSAGEAQMATGGSALLERTFDGMHFTELDSITII